MAEKLDNRHLEKLLGDEIHSTFVRYWEIFNFLSFGSYFCRQFTTFRKDISAAPLLRLHLQVHKGVVWTSALVLFGHLFGSEALCPQY